MRLFTWNMQRGSTVLSRYGVASDDFRVDSLRYDLLQDLCFQGDLGMITEPGADIRNMIKNTATEPVNGGFFVMDMRPDNQHQISACRPALWMKQWAPWDVLCDVPSGAVAAHRFPVARQYNLTKKHKLVVVALHATSGRKSGAENTREIVEIFKQYAKREGAGGLIVGGDFNAHITGRRYGSSTERRNEWAWSMPAAFTNQGASSAGGIDGFLFFTNNKSPGPIKFSISRPMPLYDIDRARYRLVLSSARPDGEPAGFQVLAGENADGSGKEWWYRLSDHSPVIQDCGLRLLDRDGAVVGAA
ncbi:MAG: hypothetical protein AAF577_13625 [Pseudomonadota bacterium]